MLSFVLLRHYTGGHHAEHHWSCILTFSVIILVSLQIIETIPTYVRTELGIILAIVACAFIALTSPIEHKNKPISSNRRKVLKKISISIATLLCLVILIGSKLTQSTAFFTMALSMASVSSSMAYAMLIKKRGGTYYESSERKT